MVLLILMSLTGSLALSQEGPRQGAQSKPLGECVAGQGRYRRTFRGGALVITIAAQDVLDEPCRAELQDSGGNIIFQTAAHSISALLVDDVNGDHEAELVLDAYSGGAHCCDTIDIVTVGSRPGLVGQFKSGHSAAFRQSKDKQYVIVTYDDAFDYFDGLCYACSPRATVYFVLEGTKFRDVSPVFAKLYDREIAGTIAQLTPEELACFRDAGCGNPTDGRWQEKQDTKTAVLSVVINYLYSGRSRQGWEAFARMWPEADQPRVRALVQKQMGEGVLRSIREWNEKH